VSNIHDMNLPELVDIRYELTLNQKALWFINALGGASQSVYNESLVYSLNGHLSLVVLQNTVDSLIKKHQMLRVCFGQDSQGNLFQHESKQEKLKITIINSLDKTNMSSFISQEIARPFDLKKAPLMRVSVIKKNNTEYQLVIVIHHLIMDGISTAILMKDFDNYYNHFVKGWDLNEHISCISYLDCVLAEKQLYLSQKYTDKMKDLVGILKGYSGLNFYSFSDSQKQSDLFIGDRVYFYLDSQLYSQLKTFTRNNRSTVFHFLLATYSIFISQYARTQDVVIGVPFANRNYDPDEMVVGYYANTLPVRILLNPTQSFIDLLSDVRKVVLSYLEKQEIAFEHIVDKLDLERKAPGQHPLIQTLFNWSHQTDDLKLCLEDLTSTFEHKYFSKTSKFDLALFMLEENKQSITAYFEYRPSLFDRSIIEQFANGFQVLIKNILNSPFDCVSYFRMMDKYEEQRMKEKFFVAKDDRTVNRSLCDFFSEVTKTYAKNTGLIFEGNRYNYNSLALRSDQWAGYIRSKYTEIYGAEMPKGTLIAMCIERHEDMIFGILGILKAGGAYVPIDPSFPKDRIDYIINDSKASLLLAHRHYNSLNIQFEKDHIIYMDNELIQYHQDFCNPKLDIVAQSKDLAYVIYTSGSTGKPKGVLITHENIISLFESVKKQAIFSNKDVWSLFHTYCFDVSVWEMWGAFLFGAMLVMIPYEVSRDPKKLYQLLAEKQITILTQTPLAFQMIINEDALYTQKLDQLRYVFFAGESLKVSILRPWIKKYGVISPLLVNMYGATEATIHTTYKVIAQEDIDLGRDNIGKPLDAFSLCIMDENLTWCPVGIVGEICIGGQGLAQGYLNREDLTHEKFIQDPYASLLCLDEKSRLYRTGDLGRWMADGSVEYLGRKDFQVKLRGFRIELGEIESVLGRYNGISQTLVLLKGQGDSAYLSAYYTLKPNEQIDEASLRMHLKSFLPDYMLPKVLTLIAVFPMTVNGKIDRNKLYQHNDNLLEEVANHLPLNTTLEHTIASVWSDVLKIDKKIIGLSSNFFELGGNSLLVVKMLSLVRAEIGRDLSISQFMREPTILALTANEGFQLGIQTDYSFFERIKKESMLHSLIQPLPQINPNLSTPSTILLTGATGFLGAYLLCELLKTKVEKIYCIIRAPSLTIAAQRLKDKLVKYRLFNIKYQTRVIPILGDLSKEQLGLSNETFNKLASEIDVIYHVGAWVNHILDFNILYKTNVRSTLKLIEFASQVKNKAIHFISTLAVDAIPLIHKSTLQDYEAKIDFLSGNGYLMTKWVSEQLLYAAFERGIAAYVYRPGNIIAGQQNVYEAEANHTLLRLKGMLQLGKGYIEDNETVEMMPVDLLVSSILKLSFNPSKFSYNLNNLQKISWIQYLLMAKARGYTFDWVGEQEWNNILKQLDETNALYKLLSFYQAKPMLKQDFLKEVLPDCIILTPSYEEMIQQQLTTLISIGFLEAPTKHLMPT
jgi:myxalamid-type nonribosomal peptide synthetase MxaA